MTQKSNVFSILDHALEVEGKLHARGELIIKGSVRGELVAERVVIAEEGVVHAEADVSSITIAGTFEGCVRAFDSLVVLSTGRCTGQVTCREFKVEAGGKLNAEINCRDGAGRVMEKKALPSE